MFSRCRLCHVFASWKKKPCRFCRKFRFLQSILTLRWTMSQPVYPIERRFFKFLINYFWNNQSRVSYKFHLYSFEMKLALPVAFQITGTCSRLGNFDKIVLSTNKRCKCLKTGKFIVWEWAFYWKWRETQRYNFVHRGCDPARFRWILKALGRDGAEIQWGTRQTVSFF